MSKTNRIHTASQNTGMKAIAPRGRQVVRKDVDIFGILMMVRRQFLTILLFIFAGIGVACYKYSVTPNKYASNASLFITTRDSSAIIAGGREGLTDDNRVNAFLPSLVAILTGDEVLTAAWNSIKDDPSKSKHIESFKFDDGVIVGRGALRSALTVHLGGDTSGDAKKANVISVTCIASSGIEARIILQEVVDQYKLYMTNRHTEQANSVTQAIERGRIDMEKGLEAATEEMKRYIQTSPHTFIGDETNNPLLTRLQDMETKLVEIDYQLLKYQNRLDIVESTIAGRDIETIPDEQIIGLLGSGGEDDQTVNTISFLAQGGRQEDVKANAQITTAVSIEMQEAVNVEMEISRLKNLGIGDDNPQMRDLLERRRLLEQAKRDKTGENGDIATLHKVGIFTYPQLLATYIDVLKGRIKEIEQQRATMQKFIADQDERVRDITEYRQTIDSMKFSIASQKDTFIQLGKRLDEVALIGNYGGYQVEILDPPSTPRRPFSPNIYLYLLVGGLSGIVIGVGLAFALDVNDKTFREPGEIEAALGIPILAQFPGSPKPINTARPKKGASVRGVPLQKLITYSTPNATACEVFTGLRTRLFLNPSEKNKNIQILQVTSPHPGDGKTMFICNMAIKTADADKKVLLVDGDIRKPDIHKWFNLENKAGLSDLLAGAKTYEEIIQPTQVNNLTVISAGIKRKNPAELLSGPALGEFIEKVRALYDVILVDSSPVLYVNDPCIIASKVDGIIYNMRVRRHGRPDVIQGLHNLLDVGAKVIGCTVNCFEKHRFYNEFAVSDQAYGGNYGGYGYGYGGGYGGGYGYGYGGYGYGYGGGYGGSYGYGYGGGYGYGYGNNYGYGYGSHGKKYGSRGYGSRQTESSDGSETPSRPDAENSPRPEREERRSA
ncbi:MAG: polysaccharide biosynthesis tyrosine autokinase [Thermoguttaceae bacterium]|nr:polysaccharide biosynthesis tyrosine autokinase [Thermoguttaceae bacterium]